MRTILILSVVLWFALSGCKKKSDKDQQIIENYIEDNHIDAIKTASGLWYRINPQGTGVSPRLDDDVSVFYKGYQTDGEVFDQTTENKPMTVALNRTLKGWQEGLQMLKEGGTILLLIPSDLGYGDRSMGNVPPNSVLIFEVTLDKVN